MADITYIPIRQLYPHPDNPRKELGDLSELAASIKENGVYQNLTVIPGHYLNSREYIAKCVDEGGDAAAAAAAWTPKAVWSSDDYTIIIGHRRAAAAQQAGLYELPCAIVEMDEREQMQTMMIENAFTTTNNFVEGAGNKYPKGTNVVVVKVGDAYKYDVLAGFVDLSGYVEKEAGKGLSDENFTAALKDKLDGMDTTIDKAIANHTATDAEVSEMLAEIYGE